MTARSVRTGRTISWRRSVHVPHELGAGWVVGRGRIEKLRGFSNSSSPYCRAGAAKHKCPTNPPPHPAGCGWLATGAWSPLLSRQAWPEPAIWAVLLFHGRPGRKVYCAAVGAVASMVAPVVCVLRTHPRLSTTPFSKVGGRPLISRAGQWHELCAHSVSMPDQNDMMYHFGRGEGGATVDSGAPIGPGILEPIDIRSTTETSRPTAALGGAIAGSPLPLREQAHPPHAGARRAKYGACIS